MEAVDRSDKPGSTNRIHSLDAYRGVLMLLGIVLHGAIPFMHGGDDVSTGVVKFSFWSVHLFRMPAFFVLSGFFGALLWQRYGAGGMLMNRFERIVLPLVASLSVAIFVVFFPVLLIDRWFNHSGNILVDAFDQTMTEIIPLGDPGHLWFLYYLGIITFGVAWWIHWQDKRSKDWSTLGNWVRRTFEHPWRFVGVLAAIHVIIMLCALVIEPVGQVRVPVNGSWDLSVPKLLYYTLFYGLGWLLFTSKTDLSKSQDSAWKLVSLGLGCVLVHTLCHDAYDRAVFNINTPSGASFLYFIVLLVNWSVALFAFSRGFMGLFYRYTAKESYLWRYVSDSSYWIYLIHLVFAVHLKDFSKPFGLPVVLDFALTVVITSLIGFVSYDLFVRSSFIGRFLNGRRYDRYGWRLNAPGLAVIALFFGGYLIAAIPYLSTERRWIERGESLSQLPFDLKDSFEKEMAIEGKEKCRMLGNYAFCEIKANVKDAREHCISMGGRLPVFGKKEDSEAFGKASYGMKVWGAWMGITDSKTEGTWLDDAGNPLTFENWRTGEPNDYGKGEDCAVIYSEGDWNDEPCKHDRHFACQFEAQAHTSESQLCKDLKDTVDTWTQQHDDPAKTSILAQSIKAQCTDAWSAAKTMTPLGEPRAELKGVWTPDLARIWKEPEFESMAGHHKTWATGYLQVAHFRVVFGTKDIGLIYRRKGKDERLTIPYTTESKTDKAIVIKAGSGKDEKTYTLTIEEKGIRITSDTIVWALKPSGP